MPGLRCEIKAAYRSFPGCCAARSGALL